MKLSLGIVLCLAALAYGRPPKPEGNPLVNKVLGFCLRLLEKAVDDPQKRTWDDVFGALAPVCEDLLKMGKPGEEGSGDKPDGSGSGGGEKPERPEKPQRQLGSGDDSSGTGGDDGSGDDGSGDNHEMNHFKGLHKVCSSLKDLLDAVSQDKRSWEEIFTTLYDVCAEVKAKIEAEEEEKADLDRRRMMKGLGNQKRTSQDGGSGSGSWGGEDSSSDSDGEKGSGDQSPKPGKTGKKALLDFLGSLLGLETGAVIGGTGAVIGGNISPIMRVG